MQKGLKAQFVCFLGSEWNTVDLLLLFQKEREKLCVLATLWDGGGAPSLPGSPHTHLPRSLSSALATAQLRMRRGSQEAEAQPSPRWLARGASPELSKTRTGPDLVGGEGRDQETGRCHPWLWLWPSLTTHLESSCRCGSRSLESGRE